MKNLKVFEEYGKEGKFELPPNHQPGTRVPKGGSCCANCEYFGKDNTCSNKMFIQWNNGSNQLPVPADQYCSDWWETKEEIISSSKEENSEHPEQSETNPH